MSATRTALLVSFLIALPAPSLHAADTKQAQPAADPAHPQHAQPAGDARQAELPDYRSIHVISAEERADHIPRPDLHRAEAFVSSTAPGSRPSRCRNRLPVRLFQSVYPVSFRPTIKQVGYNHPDEPR